MRKTPAGAAADAALKASIAAHGLLENFVVRPGDAHDDGGERFAVVAGGRRLAALKALAEEGALLADRPVPCLVAAAGDAGELSLAENTVRIAMHPADQAVAFSELAGAGATRVRIAAPAAPGDTGEAQFIITIADDGAGIADPAVLLSFGENGWPDDLVRREDAAGFGLASLSRSGCTVSSRPRPQDGNTMPGLMPGWRVELAPAHFLGEAEARVHEDHGASISFRASETAGAIR